MLRFDIATLFDDMCRTVVNESIIGRAIKAGKLEVYCHQIRDYSTDKHRRTDDTVYGGGPGMLMQPQPIYDTYRAVCDELGHRPHVIYMSPKGAVLTQKRALELSHMENIFILCGRYEGVDQRVLDEIVDEEISIGDYVLTGGELGALVVVDSVGRLCDGVLSETTCFEDESHFGGLLEYPHYTHPAEWNGRTVPDVLLTGHHANIEKWRREQSLSITLERRPDLLEKAELSEEDMQFLDKYRSERDKEQ